MLAPVFDVKPPRQIKMVRKLCPSRKKMLFHKLLGVLQYVMGDSSCQLGTIDMSTAFECVVGAGPGPVFDKLTLLRQIS